MNIKKCSLCGSYDDDDRPVTTQLCLRSPFLCLRCNQLPKSHHKTITLAAANDKSSSSDISQEKSQTNQILPQSR